MSEIGTSEENGQSEQYKNLVVPGSIDRTESGPVLLGTKCKDCGYTVFPTRSFCRDCLSENVHEIELSRQGWLKTYTEEQVGQDGFEPPYAFGIVTLPEGVQLYSLLTDYNDIDELSLGVDVELVFDKIKEDEKGNSLFGHKFRPVQGGEQ